jgi:hypothetical protein
MVHPWVGVVHRADGRVSTRQRLSDGRFDLQCFAHDGLAV